jgi:2-polyprenyl-3-methyl-5-hydroxy-6-metoxy-1,4-benzoquinol methylase
MDRSVREAAPRRSGRSADAVVEAFCARLRDERRDREEKGAPGADVSRYLGPLFTARGDLSPLGIAGYAARLRPILEVILDSPPGLRILDAGSGYGTESFLFASLGAEVTSVELIRERSEIARSRTAFFSPPAGGPPAVDFVHANILRFLQRERTFDIVWAMESISHIYPPEEFLALARPRIAPEGFLALSDPNRSSPVAWLRSAVLRGSIAHAPHRKFLDPELGTPVDFGRENIHSVRGMKRLLRATGYSVEKVSVGGFFGSTLLPRAWRDRGLPIGLALSFQRLAVHTPVLRRLGSNYTILARPSA